MNAILIISLVLGSLVVLLKQKGTSTNTTYNKTIKSLGTLYKIFLFIPLTFVYFIVIMFALVFLGIYVLGDGFLIFLWVGGIFLLLPISAILAIMTLTWKKKKRKKK